MATKAQQITKDNRFKAVEKESEADTKRITFEVSGELFRKLKMNSARTGKTMKIIVNEQLQRYLKDEA